MLKYLDGNLITFANQGKFDVIAHGVNCFCTMRSGIAPQMAKAFGCDNFKMERPSHKGDINKLGQIDYETFLFIGGKRLSNWVTEPIPDNSFLLTIVNAYTQFNYGSNHKDGDAKPIDYEALTLCMRKLKNKFSGRKFGFPKIGAGLAGGDWFLISKIIEKELAGEDITIINFVP